MSHFVVLVTNTNEEPLDSQLEPFYEQGDERDYFMEKDYFLLRDKEDVEKYLYNELKNCLIAIKDKKRDEANKKWWRKEKRVIEKIILEEDLDKQISAIQAYNGGGEDKKGLYWLCNPNAKWDWWTEGGRWNNWLVKKDGTRCNSCLVKEVDFDGMRKAEMEDAGKYYDAEMARAKENNQKPFFWGFEETPTREEYMERSNHLVAPFAVLHDGNWMEKGSMGWWGISDDKYSEEEWSKHFQEFFSKLDPEMEVTIVDCHI